MNSNGKCAEFFHKGGVAFYGEYVSRIKVLRFYLKARVCRIKIIRNDNKERIGILNSPYFHHPVIITYAKVQAVKAVVSVR